eukprot:174964-Amphidinium_carterae.1
MAGSTPALGLYATPSYSSMYVEQEDIEPGPGAYNLPPGIGYQHESTRESQPAMSLTAKHDKSWSKVMISKEHLSVFKARGTPGPGNYKPTVPKSQARVRIGTAKRLELYEGNQMSPGPVYDIRTEPSAPPVNIKFCKATRFASDNDTISNQLGSTAPGMYEVNTVFDGAYLAKSFGASHRAYDKVAFPGSNRINIGRQSPGPGPSIPFSNSGKGV